VNQSAHTAAKPTSEETVLRVGLGIVIGGIGFWLPSVVWHLVRAPEFNGRDVIGLNIGLTLFMVVLARVLQRRFPQGRGPNYMPVAAGIGMWIFGPIAMAVYTITSGTALGLLLSLWMVAFGIILFPATTFAIATYDGTLGALLLSTPLLLVVAAAGPPRHRQ
jgi:hypothetical protein